MDYLRLYHRTSVEKAKRILQERRMVSEENTREAYFSTERSGENVGYGEGLVCIVIPSRLAGLDDEFPSGEQHYRVSVDDIRPEYFQV